MNIPFAVMVWDLQHRNNPWFPEVSELSNGITEKDVVKFCSARA